MKHMRLSEWMIEVDEKMNRWNLGHERQARKATQKSIDSHDVSMPQISWAFKVLKIIHEQSEMKKMRKLKLT